MYKCPSCGAGLVFNPVTQKLKCNYCNQEFETKEIEKTTLKSSKGEKGLKVENTTNKELEENNNKLNEDVYEAIVYRCTQCGAELITTDETISTFCSYCGSSALLEGKNTKKKKPNYVIPFSKTKEECEEVYRRKLRSALFAPKDMAEEQQIEKIRGIYMPYWIYSFEKDGQDVSRGQKYKCRRGDYVYYRDFDIKTNIKAECKGITHDASANFSDSLSEAIAPFSIKDKKEFSPTYLSGYYADSEDVNESVYLNDSNEIANGEASTQLMKDKIYSKYSSSPNVKMQPKSVELGLFPVYFLATKNKEGDRISYAVVNGQTGKVAAEIPIDFKKYIIASLLLAIPIFLLLNAAVTITPGKVLVISIIFNILSLIMIGSQNKKINIREARLDDKGYSGDVGIKSKPKSRVGNNLVNVFFTSFAVLSVCTMILPFLLLSGKSSSKMIFLIVMVAMFAFIAIRAFNKKDKTEKIKIPKDKKEKRIGRLLKPIIGLIINIVILMVNPVSDSYYYAGVVISIIMVILSFSDIIKGLNLLTTRKLPQLEKRGGEEHE